MATIFVPAGRRLWEARAPMEDAVRFVAEDLVAPSPGAAPRSFAVAGPLAIVRGVEPGLGAVVAGLVPPAAGRYEGPPGILVEGDLPLPPAETPASYVAFAAELAGRPRSAAEIAAILGLFALTGERRRLADLPPFVARCVALAGGFAALAPGEALIAYDPGRGLSDEGRARLESGLAIVAAERPVLLLDPTPDPRESE